MQLMFSNRHAARRDYSICRFVCLFLWVTCCCLFIRPRITNYGVGFKRRSPTKQQNVSYRRKARWINYICHIQWEKLWDISNCGRSKSDIFIWFMKGVGNKCLVLARDFRIGNIRTQNSICPESNELKSMCSAVPRKFSHKLIGLCICNHVDCSWRLIDFNSEIQN